MKCIFFVLFRFRRNETKRELENQDSGGNSDFGLRPFILLFRWDFAFKPIPSL